MRLINPIKPLGIALALLLSGCANLSVLNVEQEPDATAQRVTEETPKTQLSAYEILAQDLKQQPNKYQRNKKRVSDSVRADFAAAIALKNQGKIREAEQALLAITGEHKSLSGPYMQLGDVTLLSENADRFARAEEQYKQAIKANRHNYHARNRLALVLRKQGKFKQAESQYKQALVSWPAFKPAYLNLGILYDLYMGNKVKALEHYQTYQALNDKPERQVKGWIADLSRQVNSQKTSQLAEAK